MTVKNAAPAARTSGLGRFFDQIEATHKISRPPSNMPPYQSFVAVQDGASHSGATWVNMSFARSIALDLFLVEIFNPGLRSVLRPEPRRGSKTNN